METEENCKEKGAEIIGYAKREIVRSEGQLFPFSLTLCIRNSSRPS